jgi:hypothetical protein
VTERRFGFVQWEFPGRLGPAPGRYPVRRYAGDEVGAVVVVGGLDAPRRPRRLAGRRSRAASTGAAPAGAPVEVTRITVVDATPLEGLEAADAWLAGTTGAGAGAVRVLGDARAHLVRAVAAHRVAAADPHVPDPDPAAALVTRVGYGAGDMVAAGRWESARILPPPASRTARSRALAPQERLAALLSGRDAALACEELALRARADLDAGRQREAALQLDVALRTALHELAGWRARTGMAARLDELAAHRDAVAASAEAALAGGLPPERVAAVTAALERLEAALRARLLADE